MSEFYYQCGFAGRGRQPDTATGRARTSPNPAALPQERLDNYTQANDYSLNGAAAFTTTTKVTVYRVGVLVYGTEPP